MNIGHSSRTKYDDCYYDDHLEESTSPLLYRLNTNQISNCNACLSTLGPRSGFNGYGTSTIQVDNKYAPAQDLVDVESILSNRNTQTTRCRGSEVNSIDVTKFGLTHARICNDFMDPLSSRLTYPAQNYRSMAINRFVDLPKNAQETIFYDFAVNSRLEAKDNFTEDVPNVRQYDPSMPTEIKGSNKCTVKCGRITQK